MKNHSFEVGEGALRVSFDAHCWSQPAPKMSTRPYGFEVCPGPPIDFIHEEQFFGKSFFSQTAVFEHFWLLLIQALRQGSKKTRRPYVLKGGTPQQN